MKPIYVGIGLTAGVAALAVILLEPEDCANWYTAAFFEVAEVLDVTRCLQAGADPNAAGSGLSLLHVAASNTENPAVIVALLKAGANLEARGYRGGTPLHRAAFNNANLAVIGALLKAGADLNARDENGEPPLHRAVYANLAVTGALLKAGADLEARNKNGWTPLHKAARFSGHPGRIVALLKAGADLEARTDLGHTPWDLAQENASLDETDVSQLLNDARF